MGKGDKKSKRGKIILGTYGVRRSQKAKKAVVVPAVKAKAPVVVEEKVKPVKAAVKTTKPKAAPKSAAKPAAKTTEKAPKPAAKATKTAAKKKE
ncbi:MAG: 30S ribosomal protein THX [Bacteroidales bacterium]|jgi:ribosomal small subunit protein bTHX|nr:30S ribosomal protein THX [Bacteroidales bacterium]